ncbi:hypothetical protein [Rufibacter hautae]|uniref:Periplasmic heavy metal sensor n=1 Tax=Rufibacter hautae TaxID=2595005 RepID=A0A5B6TAH2_9BACT|nr:hypothetical protein [Rufibacter hautae]KAA3436103.1 hypothetical protein FOA19_17015 [Rufibacter hautae]
MKTLVLIFALILSFSAISSADSFTKKKNGLKTGMRALHTKLKLSETQFVKLKSLEKERLREMIEVQHITSGTRLETLNAEINSRYEEAVLQHLTPVQQKRYLVYKYKGAAKRN